MKLSSQFSLLALLCITTHVLASPSGFRLKPITNSNRQAQKRDVFVPPIIEPNTDTVWYVGETANVLDYNRDTTDTPDQISNGAAIELRNTNIYVYAPRILAEGFDLYQGYQDIVVPDDGSLSTRNDWQIILFGDFENISDDFIIIADDSAPTPPKPTVYATHTATSYPLRIRNV
ncbi:hypothetical protein M422DRAFT_236988 [Sphaerobolus stellatus SS14]|uniref:Uncharacterized protein n=1 Tax=Sphaerobolus stellatus (strain SS14) TaxID=990650 RepID=A0A0C9UJT9_SPHS4|nr:hypothetical protein M422DRAFT_236988 [Sphaerobolus stellatus SS14]